MMHFFNYIQNLEFVHPKLFWLLIIIPILIVWYIWKHKQDNASFVVSTNSPFTNHNQTIWWFHLPFVCRIIALCLIIIALARPQSSLSHKEVDIEGIDIVMALDVSGSMMAMDFRPNRLEACKQVIQSFIENRPTDRIGLVLYSGEAYTKCPLTTDHNTLLNSLKTSTNGQIEDGTAIGDGLGTAINRLRESTAKSKVVILLSDGVNNSGYIDPLSAADLAKDDENHGVLHTGDLAYRDEDGFYFISGRKKRFLKLFGNRISLDYVEKLLKDKLQECVCVGDDTKLIVYTTDKAYNEDDIIDYLVNRTKIIRSAFVVRHIDEIPHSETGKVLYKNLSLE